MRPGPPPQTVAAPVTRTLAIPPIINDRPDEPEFAEFGSLVQSILARNFAELPGIKIVAAEAPDAIAGHAAPEYATRINLRHSAKGIGATAQLLRGETVVWRDDTEGDELAVLQFVTNKFLTGLEPKNRLSDPLTEAERAALRLPTQQAKALSAYVHARTLLDTSDSSQTDNDAANVFRGAIDRDPSFAFAQAGLSQAYSSLAKHSESKDLQQAVTAANAALDLDRKVDQAHLALALAQLGVHNSAAAVDEARNALALTPDSDDAHRVLGLALVASKNFDAGIAELKTAVALRRDHWLNYYALGRSLLVADKPADAVAPLQTMRDKVTTYESAWVNLGYAQLLLGKWDESVGNLNRALDLNAQDHFALNNLGTAYYWQGAANGDTAKYKQALTRYLEALKFYPDSAKLYMNLGDTYDVLGNKSKADALYKSAVESADRLLAKGMDEEMEAIAAKCQAKLTHFEDAEGRALKALASDPNNTKVLHKLAVIYALWKKPDEALTRLERAVELGFSPVLFRDDPDLKSLRELARFKKLIAQPAR
jgi:tetratricopeptide (TPR) repeat protein